MDKESISPYHLMIEKYTSTGSIIPYDVLKEAYDDLELKLTDLRGLARLMHTCEHLYLFHKDVMPLDMSFEVATYLLNEPDKVKKKEYYQYYNDIIEKILYEINLQDYLNE